MSKRYALGLQPIYLPFAITNNTVTPPVPTDGGALTLTVTKPDGTLLAPYTPTHDGAAGSGLYHQIIPIADLTLLGTYKWKLAVTGAGAGGTYGAFEVFDPNESVIITLDDARTQLQVDPTDHSDDDWIREQLAGITAVVEQYKHEVIVKRSVLDEIEVSGWRYPQKFRVWSAPLISLTSVVSWDGLTTWDVTQMRASSSGLIRVVAGPIVSGLVDVTYQAGYATIPENYQQGAAVILQHLYETRRGPGTIPGGVIGQEDFYNRAVPFDFPNKAKEWLGPPRPLVA